MEVRDSLSSGKLPKRNEHMKIKSILFPVDFSDRCAALVPHVEAAARRFGASVTLLHLVEPLVMPYGPVETLAFPALQTASLTAKAEELLDRIAGSAFDRVTLRKVVETGDPALCIASLARDWGIGLIMMPTRGRGAFRAALLGSVTAKVLHDADCPVWTAAHVEALSPGEHTEWRNIVCAVDLSPESTRLVQEAEELNRTFGAIIRIAHAVPGEEAFPPAPVQRGV
jgi:nucleotide-binding universal stress UspA family protein